MSVVQNVANADLCCTQSTRTMKSHRSSSSSLTENTHLLPLSEVSSSSESTIQSSQHSVSISETELLKARRLLYLSHFFNQFSENAWQFCLILFLAAFSNYESLILVCSYGLVSGACVCYFGSTAGRFVDGTNRLVVAQTFIGVENFCVLVATLFCYLLLQNQGGGDDDPSDNNSIQAESNFERLNGVPTDPYSIFLLVGIHILGATARILDSGFVVAIERDWIVVMSKVLFGGDSSEEKILQNNWLSETNVAMKQIDLSCKVVAPAFAGFFVALFDDGSKHNHGSDLRGAALFVGLLNVMALIAEYICTIKIYYKIPALGTKVSKPPSEHNPSTSIPNGDHKATNSIGVKKPRCVFRLPSGLSIYFKQPISWAGLGLSLLYLNVLSFGGIMTAYLVWRGMRLDAIGVWRGVSSAAGLAGTLVYSFLSTRMGLVDSGMCSVIFQFFCLSLSFASLFIDDFKTSTAMLIAGVCASRVGLWVFDISVTQLMQEHIPEDVRGLVGGVQESLNAFFGLLSFALGFIFPDPRDFHIYVSVGYTAVGLALLCFSLGVFTQRKRFQIRHDEN